jgi:hypothetical protein
MSININNTTVTSQLTIIFDSAPNLDKKNQPNDGPALGSGNTESDVTIDGTTFFNIRSHTEIPTEVHALQCRKVGSDWSFELQYTDTRENLTYESQSDLPQWVTNMVKRTEAEKEWMDTYTATIVSQQTSWTNAGKDIEDFVEDETAAVTAADSARVTYLSNNGITY